MFAIYWENRIRAEKAGKKSPTGCFDLVGQINESIDIRE
jgi:hypothetical protein